MSSIDAFFVQGCGELLRFINFDLILENLMLRLTRSTSRIRRFGQEAKYRVTLGIVAPV